MQLFGEPDIIIFKRKILPESVCEVNAFQGLMPTPLRRSKVKGGERKRIYNCHNVHELFKVYYIHTESCRRDDSKSYRKTPEFIIAFILSVTQKSSDQDRKLNCSTSLCHCCSVTKLCLTRLRPHGL